LLWRVVLGSRFGRLSPALFSAFVIGMLFVTIVNPIAAVTSKEYGKQMAAIFGEKDSNFTVSTTGIWLRDTLDQGKLIIHGEALNAETATIINPIIYLYGNDVHVKAVYNAALMQLTDSGWVLEDAIRWQNDGQETGLGSIMLPTGLGALDLSQSGLAPQSISVYSLPKFIKSLEKAGIPTINYLFYLYKTLSIPFLMAGISMLAARFSQRNVTRNRGVWLFSRGALLASVIFIVSYFMQIMGTSLQLPVRLAAFAPAIIILLVGAIALARTDES
jgi:lipopolysaccharide export system permease protein